MITIYNPENYYGQVQKDKVAALETVAILSAEVAPTTTENDILSFDLDDLFDLILEYTDFNPYTDFVSDDWNFLGPNDDDWDLLSDENKAKVLTSLLKKVFFKIRVPFFITFGVKGSRGINMVLEIIDENGRSMVLPIQRAVLPDTWTLTQRFNTEGTYRVILTVISGATLKRDIFTIIAAPKAPEGGATLVIRALKAAAISGVYDELRTAKGDQV